MKNLKVLGAALLLVISIGVSKAQTADEIIKNYYSAVDPDGKLGSVTGILIKGVVNEGMEIPVEVVNLKGGKMYVKFSMQGQDFKQLTFDGTDLWTLNFATMSGEKADAETSANHKLSTKDFPDPLYNYKANGYKAEYVGKETKEGTECYKLKLTKDPLTLNGEKVDNTEYYYFDTDSNIMLFMETVIQEGPDAGQLSLTSFSDYQEVDGIYFPYEINSDGQALQVKEIELNPAVDDKEFTF